MAHIILYELSNYNGGCLVSETFELDSLSYDEYMDAVHQWLDDLTESHIKSGALSIGEYYEEVIIADVEGIPAQYFDEWTLHAEAFDYLEVCIEHDKGVIDAGLACEIPLADIPERYHGNFNSNEDFAEDYLTNCGYMNDLPSIIAGNINWERVANDLMYDFNTSDDYYFSQ
jgi:antirestriction protein